jgi:thiamine biosynthesis lipoprotein
MRAQSIFSCILLSACAKVGMTTSEGPMEVSLGGAVKEVRAVGEAMGGKATVVVRCPTAVQVSVCNSAAEGALDEILRIDALTDVWSQDGDIARLNAAAGTQSVELSADAIRMLGTAQTVSASSNGAFDVTVGGVSSMWGIPGAQLPSYEEIQSRLHLVNWTYLQVDATSAMLLSENMSVVVGGVVKGDAADRALSTIPVELDAKVSIASDVSVRGVWEVQVPLPGIVETVATFKVRDTAIMTSGTFIRTDGPEGGHYAKVLDPRSGTEARGADVAIVAHPNGGIADALSTTLRVTGADTQAVSLLGGWAVVFTPDGEVVELGRRGATVRSVKLPD